MRTITLCITLLLSACATAPDPEKICTAEWIEPRAERALDRIEVKVEKALDALKSASESWIDGDSPGPLQMYRLSRAVNSLEKELKDGRGIRDLRLLAQTCDDPDLIAHQIDRLLERQKVPDNIMRFLDATGFIDRIIAESDRADRSG